jgi:hypothetical protein
VPKQDLAASARRQCRVSVAKLPKRECLGHRDGQATASSGIGNLLEDSRVVMGEDADDLDALALVAPSGTCTALDIVPPSRTWRMTLPATGPAALMA